MFKTVCLLKRRPGMSMGDFKDYYEAHHKRFGDTYLPKGARFMRRYLSPVANPMTGEVVELDYDVITETWFASRAEWEATMAVYAEPTLAAEIALDEEKLFDRSKINFCIVEEVESDLAEIG
ncbi:MAG: ethyl tert-butyl ether degradation protein EthD [Alphaproteobacteria bacterium]|nr:MAG: ethyl tert-butyl ether degradation protein EthD [Alphaproteobacteria bacterium]